MAIRTGRSFTNWGPNLKIYIKHYGRTVSWLSRKTSIEYRRLLRICNGSEPDVAEAVVISEVLDVYPLWFFDGNVEYVTKKRKEREEEKKIINYIESEARKKDVSVKEYIDETLEKARIVEMIEVHIFVWLFNFLNNLGIRYTPCEFEYLYNKIICVKNKM